MGSGSDKRLFYSLDAARGLAAFVVVIFHATDFFRGQVFASGFLAVDFFFGLSGFVLAHAYADKLTSGQMTVRQFMVVRLIRLYPLYLLALLLLLAMLCVLAGFSVDLPWSTQALLGKLPFAFLMLPSPSLDVRAYLYPFNIPGWSIFFELLVNLFYAMFCRHLHNPRIRWAVILGSAAILAIQMLAFYPHPGGDTWNTLALGVPRVAFSFFLGVQLYEWHKQRAPRRHAIHGGWSQLALVVLLGCLVAPAQPALQLVSVFLIFPMLIATLAASELHLGRVGAALRQLGVISYAVYMLHAGILIVGTRLLSHLGVAGDKWPFAAAPMLALILLASWAADRWFDGPVRSFIQGRARKLASVRLPGS